VHDTLVEVYEPSFDVVYREELSRELDGKEIRRCLAAWQIVSKLAGEKNIYWAQELAERHYPSISSDRVDLLQTLDPMENRWAMEKYRKSFFEMPLLWHPGPASRREDAFSLLKGNPLVQEVAKLIDDQWSMGNSKTGFHLNIEGVAEIDTGLVTLAESRRKLLPLGSLGPNEQVYPYWELLRESVKAIQQISTTTVADALDALSESKLSIPLSYYYRVGIPWPLLTCISAARSKAQLQQFAASMRAGQMGGEEEWLAAEKRWQANGIEQNDLAYMTDDQWPIPKNIAKIGFPFAIAKHNWRIVMMGRKVGKIEDLQKFWRTLPGLETKTLFSDYLLRFSLNPRTPRTIDRILLPEESISFLTELVTYVETKFFFISDLPLRLFRQHKKTKSVRNFLDQFGRKLFNPHMHAHLYYEDFQPRELQELARALVDWIQEDPSQQGLIQLLATLASVVPVVGPPNISMDLTNHDSIEILSSFLALQLCAPNLDDNAMKTLAERILEECSTEPTFVDFALAVYENHQMQNQAGVVFLERLNNGLPYTLISQRRAVLRILIEVLGRRIAPISDRQIWDNLELPKNLFSVLHS
jgi:hypothetical protein